MADEKNAKKNPFNEVPAIKNYLLDFGLKDGSVLGKVVKCEKYYGYSPITFPVKALVLDPVEYPTDTKFIIKDLDKFPHIKKAKEISDLVKKNNSELGIEPSCGPQENSHNWLYMGISPEYVLSVDICFGDPPFKVMSMTYEPKVCLVCGYVNIKTDFK